MAATITSTTDVSKHFHCNCVTVFYHGRQWTVLLRMGRQSKRMKYEDNDNGLRTVVETGML